MRQKIIDKIKIDINPEYFDVIDNSYLHKGHSGFDESKNETHFKVLLYASKFNLMSKINIHRYINKLLKDEFLLGMHALEIKILPNKPF